MTKFSGMLIRGITQARFFKRDEEFLRNGEGNIVFSEVQKENYNGALNNVELLITLYDLLVKHRKKEFMKNVKFYYISANDQLFSEEDQALNDFYLTELYKRNINVLFNKQLKKVSFDNFLHFDDEFKIEFNYSHIVPEQKLPSFLQYSELCGFKRSNEFIFDKKESGENINVDSKLFVI